MTTANSERTDLAGAKTSLETDASQRAAILIVNDHAGLRNGLMRLIGQEGEVGVCIQAGGAGQALETIDNHQIDLVIVDISKANPAGIELTQEIRLRCPNLPLLTLSIDDDLLREQLLSLDADQGYLAARQAGEQIIAAIRYVQLLLRSRLGGFTVLVKI
ncbi:MAG TPA: response regulator transcription factor [Sedimentisphaerales bacterium]|nr:response regulator transcription factor [Sedimentisphaerales bacterium]